MKCLINILFFLPILLFSQPKVDLNGTYNLPELPFGSAVAEGKLTGYNTFNKFGTVFNQNTSSAPLDIWNSGIPYTGQPSTVGETVELFSSSINDASAGTGARTIAIFGLDENWEEQSDTLTLNGLTGVSTTNLYTRINRGIVLTAGTGAENAGAITCRQSTTLTNIFFLMPAGAAQTQVGAYTVPSNKTLYITLVTIELSRSSGSAGSGVVALQIREEGGVFRDVPAKTVTNGSPVVLDLSGSPLMIKSKSDIKGHISAISDANTDVTIFISGYLKDN